MNLSAVHGDRFEETFLAATHDKSVKKIKVGALNPEAMIITYLKHRTTGTPTWSFPKNSLSIISPEFVAQRDVHPASFLDMATYMRFSRLMRLIYLNRLALPRSADRGPKEQTQMTVTGKGPPKITFSS